MPVQHIKEEMDHFIHNEVCEEKKHNIRNAGWTFTAILLMMFMAAIFTDPTITGAPVFGSYDCGEDGIAAGDINDILDVSDCWGEHVESDNKLFCYMNDVYDVDTELSMSGRTNDWYLANLGVDLSVLVSITHLDLFGHAPLFSYSAAYSPYDNLGCSLWGHGVVRSDNLHQCNPVVGDAAPSNLLFFLVDPFGDGTVEATTVSTDETIPNENTYMLCYDEIECVDRIGACEAEEYCVGRMTDTSESAWYDCDTTDAAASTYRCCTSACSDTIDMMCGEQVMSQDGEQVAPFGSCVEDGTSACCDQVTDCVYAGSCYDFREEAVVDGFPMVCSSGNHWCPSGFEYDEVFGVCVPIQEACYDPVVEEYCNTALIPGVNEDEWEDDSGCTREYIGLEPNIYTEACIPIVMETLDFYFYDPIIVY